VTSIRAIARLRPWTVYVGNHENRDRTGGEENETNPICDSPPAQDGRERVLGVARLSDNNIVQQGRNNRNTLDRHGRAVISPNLRGGGGTRQRTANTLPFSDRSSRSSFPIVSNRHVGKSCWRERTSRKVRLHGRRGGFEPPSFRNARTTTTRVSSGVLSDEVVGEPAE